jgi:hypothetical protein
MLLVDKDDVKEHSVDHTDQEQNRSVQPDTDAADIERLMKRRYQHRTKREIDDPH